MTEQQSPDIDPPPFPLGGGELAERRRAFDWAATPLGPPKDWPAPLRTLVNLLLLSTQPMFITWGLARIWLYNDAFAPILGMKHPGALGQPATQVWPRATRCWSRSSSASSAARLSRWRASRSNSSAVAFLGTPISTFFGTPMLDEVGTVQGLFGACIETTELVQAERRQAAAIARQRSEFEQAPGSSAYWPAPSTSSSSSITGHRQLFGSEDWLGKPLRIAFPDIADQGFYELLDQVYPTGERRVIYGAPAAID